MHILLQAAGKWSDFLPLVLIMAVFYVFMILPQMRKQKKQRSFLDSVNKGDKIVTTGGIHGKVAAINDTTFSIELEDGQRMKIEKAAVSFEMTRTAYGDKTAEKKAE